jgi:hypothetical protein
VQRPVMEEVEGWPMQLEGGTQQQLEGGRP